MSEILIKNVELPKEGYIGILVHCTGVAEVCGVIAEPPFGTKRTSAIELPPHGDLIERSSVYKVLDDRIAFYKEAGDEYDACNIACIECDILVIPTIIEGTEERE